MCPHAELLLGRATSLDEGNRRVHVVSAERELEVEVEYEQLVVTLGAISRSLPIPGLAEHALGFKSLADAIYLRNHVLRELEAAAADRENAERHLTFVFVGAGYAGVEALGELSDLVRDALRYYPELKGAPQHWVLVDAAPTILPEIPRRSASTRPASWRSAASKSGSRRRSTPSTPRARPCRTGRASRRTRSCGRRASRRTRSSPSSASRSTSAAG